jgi:hypothetical protein
MSAPEGMQPPPPPPPPQPPPAATALSTQMSPDGKYYWDGTQWMSAISPDGRSRWNGTAWVPNRKMFLGDYANQSIACGIIGFLCAPFFLFGFYAGYKAYRELPKKQTQAIIGLVLNTAGAVIWIVSLIVRFAILPTSSQ